jgi:hypothetical protein
LAAGFFVTASFAGFLPAIGMSISRWPGAAFFDFLAGLASLAGPASADHRRASRGNRRLLSKFFDPDHALLLNLAS